MTKSTSRSESRPDQKSASTAIREQSFAISPQKNLFDGVEATLAGSMNDASLVKVALAESIRKCGKSRETLADAMSAMTGTEVTVRRINAFTAESREDFRFPLELARAFCAATGNLLLLRAIAQAAGLRLIDSTESDLLELGRETLRQKRATEKAAQLENRLRGVELL